LSFTRSIYRIFLLKFCFTYPIFILPLYFCTDYSRLIDREGYKLLVGQVNEPIWQGPFYPNATSTSDWDEDNDYLNCGEAEPVYPYNNSCVFNVFGDPTEHENLASDPYYQQRRQQLADEMARIQNTTFSPNRGFEAFMKGEYLACSVSIAQFGSFMSPFLYV